MLSTTSTYNIMPTTIGSKPMKSVIVTKTLSDTFTVDQIEHLTALKERYNQVAFEQSSDMTQTQHDQFFACLQKNVNTFMCELETNLNADSIDAKMNQLQRYVFKNLETIRTINKQKHDADINDIRAERDSYLDSIGFVNKERYLSTKAGFNYVPPYTNDVYELVDY